MNTGNFKLYDKNGALILFPTDRDEALAKVKELLDKKAIQIILMNDKNGVAQKVSINDFKESVGL